MSCIITCRCGWSTEQYVDSSTMAEVIADEHESRFYRRSYQHDTQIRLKREE